MTSYKKTLSIDIETYSPLDLKKSGVYKYVEDFTILLFAYSIDYGEVKIIDLTKDELPQNIIDDIYDDKVLKTAYNAQFERVAISKYLKLKEYLNPEHWECTMVKCAMLGLPFGLGQVSEVLGLETQKMKEGKALINFFSKPCKATKSNGERTRNLPKHDTQRWELFKKYCVKDVEVENAIRKKISFFEIREEERKLYLIDQLINDMGICIDNDLIYNAISFSNEYSENLVNEMKGITNINNPNSVAQLKNWLFEQTGEQFNSLAKNTVKEIINSTSNEKVAKVLNLRLKLAKTSVKKYEAMYNAVCCDGKIRGTLQFYGANRTGRWAGRLVQVHNLPRNYLKDLHLARNTVVDGDLNLFQLLYGDVSDTLSQLVRTSFIASKNKTLLVADFSSIEARVIAWLANEKWRLKIFDDNKDIYCASASQMFNVPVEKNGVNGHLRQKGKIAELALGYQGGVGALKQMGAIEMGLEEDELQGIVNAWRNSNKAITKLWRDVNNSAKNCIENKSVVKTKHLTFIYEKGFMFIKLPSGRMLSYMRAKLVDGDMGSKIVYEGMNQTTKKWEQIETYGGKLVENIVQAIARDCLAETIINLHNKNYKIVMHVHDEVIVEGNKENLQDILNVMSCPISWADGLKLVGDGFTTDYYMKD